MSFSSWTSVVEAVTSGFDYCEFTFPKQISEEVPIFSGIIQENTISHHRPRIVLLWQAFSLLSMNAPLLPRPLM